MCNSNVITASRKLVIPASGLNLLLRETTQTVGETGTRSTTFFIRFSPTAACVQSIRDEFFMLSFGKIKHQ